MPLVKSLKSGVMAMEQPLSRMTASSSLVIGENKLLELACMAVNSVCCSLLYAALWWVVALKLGTIRGMSQACIQSALDALLFRQALESFFGFAQNKIGLASLLTSSIC